VSECDREASLMRTTWPTGGGVVTLWKKRKVLEAFELRNNHSVINQLLSVMLFEILARTSVTRICFGSDYGPDVDSASNRNK
jgi:hypothetical protein